MLKDDKITSIELRSSMVNEMKKSIRKYVDASHKYSIQAPKESTKKKLWRTKVIDDGKRLDLSATTEEGLYMKLFEFYGGKTEKDTLAELFVKSIKRKSEAGLSAKSAAEYNRLWNSYYKNSSIADRPIDRITPEEWYDFFWDMVSKNHMTKKQFKQAVIVPNCIMNYCLNRKILQVNPVRDIVSSGEFPYKKEAAYTQIKARSLSDGQVERMKEWCEKELKNSKKNKIYPYAMLFNMHLGLRVGELRGLTWDDIDLESGNVHVGRQVVNTCSMQMDGDSLKFEYAGHTVLDHLKAYENERNIPIGPDVVGLLEEVKKLGHQETEVFPMRYHTYNDKVKEAATYAGITDLRQIRSHSLRTTAASNIYSKCHDVKTVQAFLGHTTPEMTSKYIKGQDSYDNLRGLV